MPHLYILRCANNTLYVGSTNDLEQRIKTHISGRGARYTSNNKPDEIVYTEEYATLDDVADKVYTRDIFRRDW